MGNGVIDFVWPLLPCDVEGRLTPWLRRAAIHAGSMVERLRNRYLDFKTLKGDGLFYMVSGGEPKLDDVQYGILRLSLRFARDQFYHVSLNTLCEQMKCSDSIVEAALVLLADREQIKLGQYRGRVGLGGAWSYYKKDMNIAPFLYEGGNFAYKVTPLGRELLDRLSEERGGNKFMSTLNLRELQIAILKDL